MSNLLRRLPGHVVVLTAIAAVGRAHPGHDGHEGGGEFSWDFSHLSAHPVATFAIIALAVGTLVILSRSGGRRAVQSLRRSSDNR
jgi:hypothetical protein